MTAQGALLSRFWHSASAARRVFSMQPLLAFCEYCASTIAGTSPARKSATSLWAPGDAPRLTRRRRTGQTNIGRRARTPHARKLVPTTVAVKEADEHIPHVVLEPPLHDDGVLEVVAVALDLMHSHSHALRRGCGLHQPREPLRPVQPQADERRPAI